MVVSAQSIEEAIDWMNEWTQSVYTSRIDTSTSEAVMLAFQDRTVNNLCFFKNLLIKFVECCFFVF